MLIYEYIKEREKDEGMTFWVDFLSLSEFVCPERGKELASGNVSISLSPVSSHCKKTEKPLFFLFHPKLF